MSEKRPKITYATLAAPDPEVHRRYEEALEKVKSGLGRTYPMWIGGKECRTDETFEDISPIDTNRVLGVFQKGAQNHVREALAAARTSFAQWRSRSWKERIGILRKAADLISDRSFEMAAVVSLEVGKNRLEALGDVEEAADLIRYYCDRMEENDGFVRSMGRESSGHLNRSILRPYGVWAVISPFNFPLALAGGPSGAALAAGNTVVFKPASDTPRSGFMLTECLRDAGLPDGVFNFVTGPGSTVGDELVKNGETDGITFTGSHGVGMKLLSVFSRGERPRPSITEMGGKNAAIISRRADLKRAAAGVMRSAFGLSGQKCSACSRVYVEKPVEEAFLQELLKITDRLSVGDPTRQEVFMGPVINADAYGNYRRYTDALARDGRILTGGRLLREGGMARGYFVAPTVVRDLPKEHPLWQEEMFLPIVTVAGVRDLGEAMVEANRVRYGLTGGFYSQDPEEIQWYLDRIEAGVVYVNREAGATTGAWPGYQPFGGWKASGSTGKGSGGPYYLQQYMREQSQTIIE